MDPIFIMSEPKHRMTKSSLEMKDETSCRLSNAIQSESKFIHFKRKEVLFILISEAYNTPLTEIQQNYIT